MISSLLLQFSNSAFSSCFAFVDKTGRDLNHDLVDWWAELFLKEEFWAGGFRENSYDANTVNGRVFGASLRLGGISFDDIEVWDQSIGVLQQQQ